jgi:hypothetical protein
VLKGITVKFPLAIYSAFVHSATVSVKSTFQMGTLGGKDFDFMTKICYCSSRLPALNEPGVWELSMR